MNHANWLVCRAQYEYWFGLESHWSNTGRLKLWDGKVNIVTKGLWKVARVQNICKIDAVSTSCDFHGMLLFFVSVFRASRGWMEEAVDSVNFDENVPSFSCDPDSRLTTQSLSFSCSPPWPCNGSPQKFLRPMSCRKVIGLQHLWSLSGNALPEVDAERCCAWHTFWKEVHAWQQGQTSCLPLHWRLYILFCSSRMKSLHFETCQRTSRNLWHSTEDKTFAGREFETKICLNFLLLWNCARRNNSPAFDTQLIQSVRI